MTETKFAFIKDLAESQFFPSPASIDKLTLREVADLAFLHFVAIQILKSEFKWAPVMQRYAKQTLIQASTFKRPWVAGETDLYYLIYILNNPSTWSQLHLPHANEILGKQLHFSLNPIKRYLNSVANGDQEINQDVRLLLDLTRRLHITNNSYTSLRRLAQEWNDLDHKQKQMVITRLLQAFRAKANKSQMRIWLEKFSHQEQLELHDVCNVETGAGCKQELPKSNKMNLFKKFIGHAAAAAAGIAAAKVIDKALRVHEEAGPNMNKETLATYDIGEELEQQPNALKPLVIARAVVQQMKAKLGKKKSMLGTYAVIIDEIITEVANKYGITKLAVISAFDQSTGLPPKMWYEAYIGRNGLIETTAGSTSAGSIATAIGGLGAGFDPNGDWGIYEKSRKRKAPKRSKMPVIRRSPIA